MKRCTKCKTTREITCFVKDRTALDGIYSICKVCRKDYHLKNRSRIVSKQRHYNRTHVSEIKESHKRYALRRFFYIRAANLRLNHIGEETASYVELARLWKKQRGMCPLSGRRLTKANSQLDHVIPVVRGGSGEINNLRWVHRDINYAKRDLPDADFLALCQEVVSYLSHKQGRT